MGLPQDQNTAAQSQPQQSSQTTSASPKSASDLPPEAIQLATRLFDYARHGQTPELAQYLTAGIPINLTNHKGDTLLMLAAYHGHLQTVQMLLEKGADPDVLNERGQSIVAGAVFKGEDELVRELVEKGRADLEKGQPSAREAAVMFRRVGVLKLFGMDEEASRIAAEAPA